MAMQAPPLSRWAAPSPRKVDMLARSRAQAYAKSAPVPRVEGLTRDEICVRYQDKVFLVARRIHERLSRHAGVEIDDLVSWGAIGLLEAFDRFDACKGVKFSTYAEHRIRDGIQQVGGHAGGELGHDFNDEASQLHLRRRGVGLEGRGEELEQRVDDVLCVHPSHR